MKNYAVLSKSYLAKTEESTLARRAALCTLLEERGSLSHKEIVVELGEKGIVVGKSTVATDISFFSVTEKFMRGELSREEVEAETIPYRKRLYFAIYCLIADGIAPEIVQTKQLPVTNPAKEQELVSGCDKKEAGNDFLDKILTAGHGFFQDLNVLVLEHKATLSALDSAKRAIVQKKQQMEQVDRQLEEGRARTRRISGRFAGFVRKFREDKLYQIINSQGHDITVLMAEKEAVEEKFLDLKKEIAIQTELFEEQEGVREQKILELQAQNIELDRLISTLREGLALKEIELQEAQEFEERLMSGFHDGEDVLDGNEKLMECESSSDEQASGKKQYNFPRSCADSGIPIVLGEKFMESFCQLDEGVRKQTIKAMWMFAKEGSSYNALRKKNRKKDGHRQIYVNIKHRAFYDAEDGRIVFLKVLHKNSIK